MSQYNKSIREGGQIAAHDPYRQLDVYSEPQQLMNASSHSPQPPDLLTPPSGVISPGSAVYGGPVGPPPSISLGNPIVNTIPRLSSPPRYVDTPSVGHLSPLQGLQSSPSHNGNASDPYFDTTNSSVGNLTPHCFTTSPAQNYPNYSTQAPPSISLGTPSVGMSFGYQQEIASPLGTPNTQQLSAPLPGGLTMFGGSPVNNNVTPLVTPPAQIQSTSSVGSPGPLPLSGMPSPGCPPLSPAVGSFAPPISGHQQIVCSTPTQQQVPAPYVSNFPTSQYLVSQQPHQQQQQHLLQQQQQQQQPQLQQPQLQQQQLQQQQLQQQQLHQQHQLQQHQQQQQQQLLQQQQQQQQQLQQQQQRQPQQQNISSPPQQPAAPSSNSSPEASPKKKVKNFPTCGGRKTFVGQLPKDITRQQLSDIMKGFGEIDDVKMLLDKKTGQGTGAAFVVFKEPASAMKAVGGLHNRTQLPGMATKMQIRLAEGEYDSSKDVKLFVGQIPPITTQSELYELFKHDNVLECALLTKDNKPRGCAFVRYSCRETAEAAVARLNGKVILEGAQSPITVRIAYSEADKRRKGRTAGHTAQSGKSGSSSPGYSSPSSAGRYVI